MVAMAPTRQRQWRGGATMMTDERIDTSRVGNEGANPCIHEHAESKVKDLGRGAEGPDEGGVARGAGGGADGE